MTHKQKLEIQYVDPDSLMPVDWNPRKITSSALAALAKLMDVHGFVDPVIARQEDRMILGGHQRITANRKRKHPADRVPVIFLSGISDDKAKALNIALNNPAAQGRYDYEALSILVDQIDTTSLDLAEATGLARKELEELAGLLKPPEPLVHLDPPTCDDKPCDDEVVLIFEMTSLAYAAVKGEFDRLITKHNLYCHVRMEAERAISK